MSTDGNARASEPLLERPLSARSLIASLLLRTQPPRMSGSRCVQWCGLFGVAEGTTRVALSRMVERGELRTRDGMYELAGRVQSRRGAQDWSLDPVLTRWRGDWRVAIVPAGPRDAGPRAGAQDARRRHDRCGLATRTSARASSESPADLAGSVRNGPAVALAGGAAAFRHLARSSGTGAGRRSAVPRRIRRGACRGLADHAAAVHCHRARACLGR